MASSASERDPLIGQRSRSRDGSLPIHRPVSYSSRPVTDNSELSKPPLTFFSSFRWLFFGTWFNLMLVFVPLSFASHFAHWAPVWVFTLSFIAIVPLAKLLGDSTEQASMRLGQTLGGLLNATFGNAVELIVGIVGLVHGELRIVQTSMLGSILSNILLVLGMSFFAGGFYFYESNFQVTAAQTASSILTLGGITMVIPAAYQAAQMGSSDKTKQDGLLFISRGTAVILLFVYGTYLYFQLKSHAYLYAEPSQNAVTDASGEGQTEAIEEEAEEEEEEHMTPVAAIIGLVIITVVTSFCADYLVGAIDDVARDYGLPKPFIGTILLPIVGNAAEHVTSVWMAMKGKMELAIGVSVGSSIQIAVGVVPALVVVAWIMKVPLTLYFHAFETTSLIVSVLLVNLLLQDGKSNYMEGMMLISLYIVIALAFWVQQEDPSVFL